MGILGYTPAHMHVRMKMKSLPVVVILALVVSRPAMAFDPAAFMVLGGTAVGLGALMVTGVIGGGHEPAYEGDTLPEALGGPSS